MSFDELRDLVQSKFDFKIALYKPYKICDFRPAFGLIFEEYLQDYDFWGHCDFDMIFGDLRKYFTEELLNSYDKILPLGHLSLYRNNLENNKRFILDGSEVGDFKTVFMTDKAYAFDEIRGIGQIFKKNNYAFYDERIFADISTKHKRFKLGLKDINYKNQIFTFDNGKIFREFFINGNYKKDEFIYIHIRKPKNLQIKCSPQYWDRFYITNTGFYEKKGDAKLDDINKFNKYNGWLYESYEKAKGWIAGKKNGLIKKIRMILPGKEQ